MTELEISDADRAALEARVAALEASNAALLGALQGILYHFVPMQGNLKVENDMIERAHAAIAKATRDQT